MAACLWGCTSGMAEIRLGYADEVPMLLVGNLIHAVLEDEGVRVKVVLGPGTTEEVRQHLLQGEIDIAPDDVLNGGTYFGEVGETVWNDPDAAFNWVRALDGERHGLIWLDRAPAETGWTIALRQDLADGQGIRTLSQLTRYVKSGGVFRLGITDEFFESVWGLGALYRTYGLGLKPEQLWFFPDGERFQAQKAAALEEEGVKAAVGKGSDGSLIAFDLVPLEDDRHALPAGRIGIVAVRSLMDRVPELGSKLVAVLRRLDGPTLRKLNFDIAVEGKEAADVARSFLSRR